MSQTPGPWEGRVSKDGYSYVISPSVPKKGSRTADGPFGEESWAAYGGELVCESCTEDDAKLIAQAPVMQYVIAVALKMLSAPTIPVYGVPNVSPTLKMRCICSGSLAENQHKPGCPGPRLWGDDKPWPWR